MGTPKTTSYAQLHVELQHEPGLLGLGPGVHWRQRAEQFGANAGGDSASSASIVVEERSLPRRRRRRSATRFPKAANEYL